VIIYQHVAKLESESNGARALTNAECPQCKSTGRVPIHHGLRDKECPRCGARWWIFKIDANDKLVVAGWICGCAREGVHRPLQWLFAGLNVG